MDRKAKMNASGIATVGAGALMLLLVSAVAGAVMIVLGLVIVVNAARA